VQLAATSRWNAERLVVYNVTLSELRAGGTETGRHKGSMRDGDRERSGAPGKGDVSTVGPFQGGEALGGALMLVFFAALGACADPRAVLMSGGPTLAFIAVQLSVQLACCLLVGRHLLKLPTWAVLTASNANVGGPATAAAMASARGWTAAVQPAIVTGTLGYVIGTPLGCAVGQALRALTAV